MKPSWSSGVLSDELSESFALTVVGIKVFNVVNSDIEPRSSTVAYELTLRPPVTENNFTVEGSDAVPFCK